MRKYFYWFFIFRKAVMIIKVIIGRLSNSTQVECKLIEMTQTIM